MKYYHYYESPIGKLVIVHNDRGITNTLAHLLQIENAIQEETDLIKEAVKQLDEYFNGLRQSFDLPLAPAGTHLNRKFGKPFEIFLVEKLIVINKSQNRLTTQKLRVR